MTNAPKTVGLVHNGFGGWRLWTADDADDPTVVPVPYILDAEHERLMAERDAEIARLRKAKDGAYDERNRLVALLASIFPSGRAETNIPGWDAAWHGCVYIDFPWGQASWHFHDSQTHLFAHLPAYLGEWDGHTTEDKYEAIARAALGDDNG